MEEAGLGQLQWSSINVSIKFCLFTAFRQPWARLSTWTDHYDQGFPAERFSRGYLLEPASLATPEPDMSESCDGSGTQARCHFEKSVQSQTARSLSKHGKSGTSVAQYGSIAGSTIPHHGQHGSGRVLTRGTRCRKFAIHKPATILPPCQPHGGKWE